MPRINILSPHVADLIAAGEVVERPASAVKELLENAIDAGARNITVEFSGGGAELIRITDDGCGMSAEDAGVAFLRHATSKLHDERGLESIGTLGFRGEALAAISSVSHIELTTCEHGAAEGTYMSLDAGDIQEMRPAGAPEGTSIAVRGLFYNTPRGASSSRATGQRALPACRRRCAARWDGPTYPYAASATAGRSSSLPATAGPRARFIPCSDVRPRLPCCPYSRQRT